MLSIGLLDRLVSCPLCLVVAAGCGDSDRDSPPASAASAPRPADGPDAAAACLRDAGAYVESLDVPAEEGPRAPYRELRVRMPGGTIAFVGYYQRLRDARRAARLANERNKGL